MPAHFPVPTGHTRRLSLNVRLWIVRIAFAVILSIVLLLMAFGTSALSH